MRKALALLCLASFIGGPSLAHAQVPLDIGFSVKGGPNGSGIGKPDEETYNGQSARGLPYPGFFGVGGGVGFFVEPRVFNLIGIEFGVQWAFTQGEGDIDRGAQESKTNVEEREIIIPIHLRFSPPAGDSVHMLVFIGADILIPLDVELHETGNVNFGIQKAEREGGTMLGFGFGVEIDVGVGLFIPIEFKGRWNPHIGETFDDRLELEFTGNTATFYAVKPNWEWQGEVMLGLGYRLDILKDDADVVGEAPTE